MRNRFVLITEFVVILLPSTLVLGLPLLFFGIPLLVNSLRSLPSQHRFLALTISLMLGGGLLGFLVLWMAFIRVFRGDRTTVRMRTVLVGGGLIGIAADFMFVVWKFFWFPRPFSLAYYRTATPQLLWSLWLFMGPILMGSHLLVALFSGKRLPSAEK